VDKFPSWVKVLSNWSPSPSKSINGRRTRWNVYRDTTRTRRLVGYLEYNWSESPAEENIPENILGIISKECRKAERLSEERLLSLLSKEAIILGMATDNIVSELINSGYLGRWIRLNSDEKTIHSVAYGPMPPLIQHLGEQQQLLLKNHFQWITEREQRLQRILLLIENNQPAGDTLNTGELFQKSVVNAALRRIAEHIQAKLEELSVIGQDKKTIFHTDYPWPLSPTRTSSKYHLGVDFLLALAECLLEMPEGYEWKEIGARFNPSIGGSKYFDQARGELIQMAETVCGVPLDSLGLTSLGSLYPLYILGDLRLARGDIKEVYPDDTICALSNIQVNRTEEAITRAGRIILTENRALLLKMEATGWQRRQSESLIIGIDGRVRLAHRRLLKMLAATGPGKAFFSWVDTDPSGIDIARQVHEILPHCLFVSTQLETAMVLPYHEWLCRIQEEQDLRDREQEELLGGPEKWDQIFNIIHLRP